MVIGVVVVIIIIAVVWPHRRRVMGDCKPRTGQDINKTRTCGAVREFIETVGSRLDYVQNGSCACARRRGWQPMLNHRRATSPSNLPTLLHCRPSRLALCATGLEQLKLSRVLSQIILSPRPFLLENATQCVPTQAIQSTPHRTGHSPTGAGTDTTSK